MLFYEAKRQKSSKSYRTKQGLPVTAWLKWTGPCNFWWSLEITGAFCFRRIDFMYICSNFSLTILFAAMRSKNYKTCILCTWKLCQKINESKVEKKDTGKTCAIFINIVISPPLNILFCNSFQILFKSLPDLTKNTNAKEMDNMKIL